MFNVDKMVEYDMKKGYCGDKRQIRFPEDVRRNELTLFYKTAKKLNLDPSSETCRKYKRGWMLRANEQYEISKNVES